MGLLLRKHDDSNRNFVGIYLRWLRPGKIQEATVIGVVLIFAAIITVLK